MIKICKECGKEFEAKNGRQQYCTGPHFRPCPVCGKLVEIKYLSDPTPKCTDCRKHRIINPVKEEPVEVTVAPIGPETLVADKPDPSKWSAKEFAIDEPKFDYDSAQYVTRKYVGRTTSGFVTNHIYTVALLDNPPCLLVHAKEDQTSGDDLDISIGITNTNSWKHFFKEV